LKSSYFFLGLRSRVKNNDMRRDTVMIGGIFAQVRGGSRNHLKIMPTMMQKMNVVINDLMV
jgi:hypothetical protein